MPLRFINLGYSEFQDDEKKATIRKAPDTTLAQFFMEKRKGPMQFIVSSIPYAITGDYRNELAQRAPFAIANLASVLVLYFLLFKLSGSRMGALFGTALYSVNGFMVGFSRIAQYQSLNLLFSFLALYLYSSVMSDREGLLKKTLLGTVFYCLSVLSHWDAVFMVIPIIYFFYLFVRRNDLTPNFKLKVFAHNFLLGSICLLPFLIPYLFSHLGNSDSSAYFNKRFGLSDYSYARHRYIFELYNPFITIYAYFFILIASVILARKRFVYLLWFLVNFLAIKYFMTKPGTHIYNYVIPIFFLTAFLYAWLEKHLKLIFKVPVLLSSAVLCGLLFYQSYLIFVDHQQEYPWDEKIIFNRKTQRYLDKEVLTFGFPHFRNWKEVNKVMLDFDPNCNYITNEGKEISQFYTDLFYGDTKKCVFIVEVKRPFISTRDGVKFPRAKKIYSYKRGEEILVKVYVKGDYAKKN